MIEHITINNFPVGRNVDEALRTLQVGGPAGVLLAHSLPCPAAPGPARCDVLPLVPLPTLLALEQRMPSPHPHPGPCWPQAVQYVAEHGEVCPAGWKPGGRTMVADPEKSLEYFATVGEGEQVGQRPWSQGPGRGRGARGASG